MYNNIVICQYTPPHAIVKHLRIFREPKSHYGISQDKRGYFNFTLKRNNHTNTKPVGLWYRGQVGYRGQVRFNPPFRVVVFSLRRRLLRSMLRNTPRVRVPALLVTRQLVYSVTRQLVHFQLLTRLPPLPSSFPAPRSLGVSATWRMIS